MVKCCNNEIRIKQGLGVQSFWNKWIILWLNYKEGFLKKEKKAEILNLNWEFLLWGCPSQRKYWYWDSLNGGKTIQTLGLDYQEKDQWQQTLPLSEIK